MSTLTISPEVKLQLKKFFEEHGEVDKHLAFLLYLELSQEYDPTIYKRTGLVYKDQAQVDGVIAQEEENGLLYTESKKELSPVKNVIPADAKRIYSCPFCGECRNDAEMIDMYSHVSHCEKNTERSHGSVVKRFETITDPELIAKVVTKKEKSTNEIHLFFPLKKLKSGELSAGSTCATKEAAKKVALKNQVEKISLTEMTATKYLFESEFLSEIQEQFEENIDEFSEAMMQDPDLEPYAAAWVEEEDED